MEPSVGIVMRTRDRAVLLRRALESVRAQSYRNWRLVVVNDAGAPGPVMETVQTVFDGDDRVEVVHNAASQGMEAAINDGLRPLSTDLAVVHDDDDTWAPAFLETAVRVLAEVRETFPDVQGIATAVEAVYERIDGQTVLHQRSEPWHADPARPLEKGLLDVQRMLERNCLPPIAFVYDLSAARALGLYDGSLQVLGDWDFHSRFVMAHDVWIHPEPLARYHHRAAETGALGNSIIAGREKHRIFAQRLRNRWVRRQLGPEAENRLLLSELDSLRAETASLRTRLDRLERDTSRLRPRRYLLFGPRRNA